MFNKVPLSAGWSFKLPVCVLLVYFFVVFPTVHYGLRDVRWVPEYGYLVFYAVVIVGLLATRKGKPTFPQALPRHLLIGIILGVALVGALPLLDALVELSPLSQQELFSAAVNSRPLTEPLGALELMVAVLLVPLLEQMFFIGFIAKSFLLKYPPVNAIFLAVAVFVLGHFNLQISTLFLGFASVGLFHLTGTIVAGLMFHISCAVGWIVLTQVYPRLITFLIFLF